MKTKLNKELTSFVASALRHAVRNGDAYMIGYLQASKRILVGTGKMDVAAWCAGWRWAR